MFRRNINWDGYRHMHQPRGNEYRPSFRHPNSAPPGASPIHRHQNPEVQIKQEPGSFPRYGDPTGQNRMPFMGSPRMPNPGNPRGPGVVGANAYRHTNNNWARHPNQFQRGCYRQNGPPERFQRPSGYGYKGNWQDRRRDGKPYGFDGGPRYRHPTGGFHNAGGPRFHRHGNPNQGHRAYRPHPRHHSVYDANSRNSVAFIDPGWMTAPPPRNGPRGVLLPPLHIPPPPMNNMAAGVYGPGDEAIMPEAHGPPASFVPNAPAGAYPSQHRGILSTPETDAPAAVNAHVGNPIPTKVSVRTSRSTGGKGIKCRHLVYLCLPPPPPPSVQRRTVGCGPDSSGSPPEQKPTIMPLSSPPPSPELLSVSNVDDEVHSDAEVDQKPTIMPLSSPPPSAEFLSVSNVNDEEHSDIEVDQKPKIVSLSSPPPPKTVESSPDLAELSPGKKPKTMPLPTPPLTSELLAVLKVSEEVYREAQVDAFVALLDVEVPEGADPPVQVRNGWLHVHHDFYHKLAECDPGGLFCGPRWELGRPAENIKRESERGEEDTSVVNSDSGRINEWLVKLCRLYYKHLVAALRKKPK